MDPLGPDQDLELMQRVAADDEAAIARLYDRFGPLVYRMAYQAMPDRTEAEDVVQEVFIRLWATAGRFDPKRASLVTWVMLLARRLMVDRLRRMQSRIRPGVLENESAVPSEAWSPTGDMEKDERFTALLERIEQLPDLQKTVVKRAYLGGQTLKQIGVELGVPIGTIKSALSRALVRLRELNTGEEQAT